MCGRVADLGCGKLRHYDLLLLSSHELYLVDTDEQLSATHSDAGQEYNIRRLAEDARARGRNVHALSSTEFALSKLGLDLVVCVAVLDVVVPRTRAEIITAAVRNLGALGLLVVIAPRNDSTILRRCGPESAYYDGHTFFHHGIHTFFHNFRDHARMTENCKKAGLVLKKDLSCYRQVCLVFGTAESQLEDTYR
jgi:hypothetical protein